MDWASDAEWRVLIEHYAGNPLALKMVAPAIRDLFDSRVAKFLELLAQGTLAFQDIRNLLERQFNRLSNLEKDVMYRLAISRESVALTELLTFSLLGIEQSEICRSVLSLQRRGLIEKSSEGFTQQPVVMEYITELIIEQICQDIVTQKISLFRKHALLKAQAKQHIKDIQIRLILKPITNKLLIAFASPKYLDNRLVKILSSP